MNQLPKLRSAAISIIASVLLLTHACKKTPPTSSIPNSPYQAIVAIGQLAIGKPVQFLVGGMMPDERIMWDFGDGGTSTADSPTHVFQLAGNYEVTAVVIDDHSNAADRHLAVTITVRDLYDAAVVQRLSGKPYWEVSKDQMVMVTNGFTYLSVNIGHYKDTFAIEVLDCSTIVVKGDTLTDQGDLVDASEYYTFRIPGGEFSWKKLQYYFTKDSISYSYHPYQGEKIIDGKPPLRYALGTTTTYTTR